ncbi:hypothetical protein ACCQ07_21845 (plasmid) [Xanthomonas sp. NCPPB 3583]|uniref:hypothetical protein n=1 Tax=Xanthomonas sp. NCPPB 3583 TaxID=487558 RepID=UPI0035578511
MKNVMNQMNSANLEWVVIFVFVIVAIFIAGVLAFRYNWIGYALHQPPQQLTTKPASTPATATADTPTSRSVRRSATSEMNDSEDFSLSLVTAAATNSALIGFAAGGSITGAIIGDALVPDSSFTTCTDSAVASSDGGVFSSCSSDSASIGGTDW